MYDSDIDNHVDVVGKMNDNRCKGYINVCRLESVICL